MTTPPQNRPTLQRMSESNDIFSLLTPKEKSEFFKRIKQQKINEKVKKKSIEVFMKEDGYVKKNTN